MIDSFKKNNTKLQPFFQTQMINTLKNLIKVDPALGVRRVEKTCTGPFQPELLYNSTICNTAKAINSSRLSDQLLNFPFSHRKITFTDRKSLQ